VNYIEQQNRKETESTNFSTTIASRSRLAQSSRLNYTDKTNSCKCVSHLNFDVFTFNLNALRTVRTVIVANMVYS